MELLQAGAYAPDARVSVWAYAPWLNNTLHGIVAVLGGRVAHGALNGLWLVLIACLAWRAMAVLGASAAVRLAGVQVVSTIPMVGGLATGMQTELPATAVMLALCGATFDRRSALGPVAVAALCAGTPAVGFLTGDSTHTRRPGAGRSTGGSADASARATRCRWSAPRAALTRLAAASAFRGASGARESFRFLASFAFVSSTGRKQSRDRKRNERTSSSAASLAAKPTR